MARPWTPASTPRDKSAPAGPGEGTSPATFYDPVELALADALQRASVAGAWTVVERLAGELEARRRERAQANGLADVVTLNSARKVKHKAEPAAIDPRQTDLFKPKK